MSAPRSSPGTERWFERKNDARLGCCSSDGCGGQPTWRLEAEGVGSNYCSGCKARIEKSAPVLTAARNTAEGDPPVTLDCAGADTHPTGRDFYEMSGPDLLNYCGADASKWAKAFCRIKEVQGWSAADVDESLMLGWFANAIEHSQQVRGVAQSSWRPIETAPKDGARIILAWDNIPSLPYHWEVGFFRSNSRRSPTESYSGWCNTYGHAFSGEPTHWMLPAPPSNQGASK